MVGLLALAERPLREAAPQGQCRWLVSEFALRQQTTYGEHELPVVCAMLRAPRFLHLNHHLL